MNLCSFTLPVDSRKSLHELCQFEGNELVIFLVCPNRLLDVSRSSDGDAMHAPGEAPDPMDEMIEKLAAR
ncbi:hypothetical protein ACHMXE_03380 [Variovorax sp. UC122_21]